jgi:Ca2+-binding RTX toxin-like protein
VLILNNNTYKAQKLKYIWFEDGNDVLFGGPDSDTLCGGVGDDVLAGESGDDWLGDAGYYSAGNAVYFAGLGEMGNDYLFGGPGDDDLYGGVGSDHLYGDADADYLDAGAHYLPGDGRRIEGPRGGRYPQDDAVDYLYGGSGVGDEAAYVHGLGTSYKDHWNAGSEDIAIDAVLQIANAVADQSIGGLT